tara:strand:- start:1326 stop:1832 length:507 start_codon:yes stop_codon:yes gene_type:complete
MEINIDLFNLIPDDIMYLIWKQVKPSIKYYINKQNFYKYYKYRLAYVNNTRIKYNNIFICDCYLIKNLNYIKYLINIDAGLILNHIIKYKIKNDNSKFIINKKLKFENIKFNNFIDFCYFYSKKFNSKSIKNIIEDVMKYYNKKYDVVVHEKNKNYKYIKNKNIRWSA